MAEDAPKEQTTGDHAPASSGDLMSSVKILTEAGQSAFGKDGSPMDKAKVAGAAEDILEAAERYGKLDEKSGVGQYVDKAEDYLHQYHSSDSKAPAATAAKGEEKKEEEEVKPSGEDGGGVGDAINKAKKGLGGFFS